VKTDLIQIKWNGMIWTCLSQNSILVRARIKTIRNYGYHNTHRISCPGENILFSEEKLFSLE
jgi:hypothetical protein